MFLWWLVENGEEWGFELPEVRRRRRAGKARGMQLHVNAVIVSAHACKSSHAGTAPSTRLALSVHCVEKWRLAIGRGETLRKINGDANRAITRAHTIAVIHKSAAPPTAVVRSYLAQQKPPPLSTTPTAAFPRRCNPVTTPSFAMPQPAATPKTQTVTTTITTTTSTCVARKTLLHSRDVDAQRISIASRILLLLIASALVTGCATLTLFFRAVPKNILFAVLFAAFYAFIANCLQPTAPKPPSKKIKPPALSQQLSRLTVRFCLLLSLLLSVVIPWIWILTFNPTPQHRKLLAPHLFLMMAQVLFEIWSYRLSVSLVVRIAIPVAFVTYRLTVLYEWVHDAFVAMSSNLVPDQLMFVLAFANFAFWNVILFYVLLLKVCPPYFLDRREDVSETASRPVQSARKES